MGLTNITKKHVIEKYVEPARFKGETTVQIRVGNVVKELGWANRTPSVFSTLSSRAFQREAGLELIEKRGGPSSGGPSTTVQFVYRILGSMSESPPRQATIPNGAGLLSLYGFLANSFRVLGGGEAFLNRERTAWESDAGEKPFPKKKAKAGNER